MEERALLWCKGNVWIWTQLVVRRHYQCTKCHHIAHFKIDDFMSCEFHYDKVLVKIQHPAPSPTSIATTLVHITTFSHLDYYQLPDGSPLPLLSLYSLFSIQQQERSCLENKIMFLLCWKPSNNSLPLSCQSQSPWNGLKTSQKVRHQCSEQLYPLSCSTLVNQAHCCSGLIFNIL